MNLATAALQFLAIGNPIPMAHKDLSQAFFLHAVVGKGAKNKVKLFPMAPLTCKT
jgi:hypothetical protein